MLVWFVVAFVNEMKLRNELRTLRRKREELQRELRVLRNQPLEEPDPEHRRIPAGQVSTDDDE